MANLDVKSIGTEVELSGDKIKNLAKRAAEGILKHFDEDELKNLTDEDLESFKDNAEALFSKNLSKKEIKELRFQFGNYARFTLNSMLN